MSEGPSRDYSTMTREEAERHFGDREVKLKDDIRSTRLDRDHLKPSDLDPKYDMPFFWADPETCNTGCGGAAGRKRASFHLPRWASRLVLDVTDVRVQRLQEISEKDARAEGGQLGGPTIPHFYREAFQSLWDGINGKRAPWASNPWVWAVTFRRIQQ